MKITSDEIKGFLLLIIVTVLSFLTTGCGTPQKEIVVKTDTKVIITPEHLLKPCPVAVPPNKLEYKNLDLSGRESKLTLYVVDLLKDLSNCNGQIKSIIDFQKKEVDIVNKVKESK